MTIVSTGMPNDIGKDTDYGKLCNRDPEQLEAGARIEVSDKKRNPGDFALWKAAKPGEPSWPSPWGDGRPGWHIECSAMAMEYLGSTFDVHGGGEDLVFPHHECEIAQSEAATRKTFARYWVHNGFVNLGAEKMSKSLGNTLLIRELVKRHDPDALRLWLLGTHYRHPVEFSEERLNEAGRALERFSRLFREAARYAWPPGPVPDALRQFRLRFEAAMDDDFNTPQALGALFDLARALYEHVERTDEADAQQALVAGVDEVKRLGGALGLFARGVTVAGPPAEVDRLVSERSDARKRRDWRRSDELRDELQKLGWSVEDTPSGPRLTPRR